MAIKWTRAVLRWIHPGRGGGWAAGRSSEFTNQTRRYNQPAMIPLNEERDYENEKKQSAHFSKTFFREHSLLVNSWPGEKRFRILGLSKKHLFL